MPERIMSIYPTYAVEFMRYDWTERNVSAMSKPPVRMSTGRMSKESRKQLMNSVNWLKLFSPMESVYCKDQKRHVRFRLNFITLTLSQEQHHSDSYIKQHMFEPFLKYLIRQGLNSYIWKAETQSNGRLHFHVTCNKYIYWRKVRNKWNQLQREHGYLSNYFSTNGDFDANSTDVKAVRKDKQIGAYLGKYFSKSDDWCKVQGEAIPNELANHPSRLIDDCISNDKPLPTPKRQVEGRKWSMSNNLSGLRCYVSDSTNDYMDVTSTFIRAQNATHISTDFADIWFYPHIIDSAAPEVIISKLQCLQAAVRTYKDPPS